MSLYGELKRRNVFRVAIAYLAAAWLLIEVAGTLFPGFGIPDWAFRFVVIVLAIGFLPTLVFSWAYEITQEGVRREKDVVRDASITHITAKRLDGITIGLIVVALAFIVADRLWLSPKLTERVATTAEAVTEQVATEPEATAETDKSIAVLPFVNMSDDPGNEYFSDGISEELLNLLTKIPELQVVSRSSAFAFKGEKIDSPEVAKKLNVTHILEGSVRKAGNRVRITAQLIEARSDTHLWSATYDRTLDDIFAIQDEIAGAIVDVLRLTLLGDVPQVEQINLEAYQAYLQGKHLLQQPHFTLESWNRALAILEHAVEIDPGFTLAWALLAQAHSRLVYFKVDPSQERLAKAEHAMKQAVAGDPDSPEVHLTAGYYHLWALRDAEGAQKEFHLAARHLPNSSDLFKGLGESARLQGRIDDAIVHYRRAVELSPLDPSPVVELGLSQWWARQYEEALQSCDRAVTLAPNHAWPYLAEALNYWSWKGNAPEARVALEAITYEHPWLPFMWYWQEFYEGRYAAAIGRLASTPGDWIELKICIRPKPLLESYARGLLHETELARAAAERAVAMLEEKVRDHPEEPRYHSSLGIALAITGRQEEAIREGRFAVELFPLSSDAIYAQFHVQDLAHIYVLVGDYSSACAQLELLLSIPGWISIPLLDTDPRWAPLRDQSCYQDLLVRYRANQD